jgi:hypothetical protein
MSGAAGTRFFWYDNTGTLNQSTSVFNFITSAPVAVCYWNGTAGLPASLGWELHGLSDAQDHSWKHLTVGTRYVTGFSQTSSPLVSGNPTGDLESLIWLTGGTLFDEDISVVITSSVTPTNRWDQNLGSGLTTSTAAVIPFMYVNNSGIQTYVAPNFPDRFQYISSGVRTDTPSGNFAVYWIFGTSTVLTPDSNYTNVGSAVYTRAHDATFGSLTAAQAASYTTLNWANTSIQENKVLYRLIYQCSNGYTNATHRCKLVEVYDFRTAASLPVNAVSASDHLLLTNLNAGTYGDGGHSNLAQTTISASSNPTSSNDILAYKQLSLWLNQNTDQAYINVDNTASAAIWKQLIFMAALGFEFL